MQIVRAKDYKDMSRKAANILSAQIIIKPDCVLGLATGSSPIGTYKQLIEWYNKDDLDFSLVKTVNLDEYKGLNGEHEQSYRHFMNVNLFDHVNIDKSKTFVPNGLAQNEVEECFRYNKVIDDMHGVDMQLLGLGHNGHIGFNEPCEEFKKGTHCVSLAESTINANARLFDNEEEVPRKAFTMGIKTIMDAEKVVVIVSGKEKADIVKKAFFGPITPLVPASILQMHQDVVLVGDEEALSLI
ncbi:MAG: glucosamine-6-phosphate deaminase [Lachnospiraceae bacterium]